MLWARMLAYVTGMVNQELLLRNEYLGGRRVSTTLRQVLTKFSEFLVCWIRVPSFPQEISRQDRLATTIGNSVDPHVPKQLGPFPALRLRRTQKAPLARRFLP
jgi:hypothetical protein